MRDYDKECGRSGLERMIWGAEEVVSALKLEAKSNLLLCVPASCCLLHLRLTKGMTHSTHRQALTSHTGFPLTGPWNRQ